MTWNNYFLVSTSLETGYFVFIVSIFLDLSPCIFHKIARSEKRLNKESGRNNRFLQLVPRTIFSSIALSPLLTIPPPPPPPCPQALNTFFHAPRSKIKLQPTANPPSLPPSSSEFRGRKREEKILARPCTVTSSVFNKHSRGGRSFAAGRTRGGGGKRRLARGSGIFSWKIIRGWDSGGGRPGWLSNCGGGGEEQVQSP